METLEQKIARVVKEHVSVVPYDPDWPRRFEQERDHLLSCLPSDLVKRIEHFGSTAVPGLAAKPIVDLLVEVTDLEETKKRIAPLLEAQGYDYFWRPSAGDRTPPFYAWFIKRDESGVRTHHIHMVEAHFEHWDRLFFRDYLIQHPEVAREYADLKMRLSERHDRDRVAYSNAKSAFVTAVTARAKEQFQQAAGGARVPRPALPDDLPLEFLARLETLASAYLAQSDPYLQSGFGGGAARWRAEREPILEAVEGPRAELLDVGCANGLLLESLIAWAAPGREITPFGVDQSTGLVALAQRRLPRFADHFFVGNAWSWHPPRRFAYVYALSDCVPADRLQELIHRLLERCVAPGGRLILGSYGSLSRGTPPLDLPAVLAEAGLPLVGSACGGQNGIARFAWTDAAT